MKTLKEYFSKFDFGSDYYEIGECEIDEKVKIDKTTRRCEVGFSSPLKTFNKSTLRELEDKIASTYNISLVLTSRYPESLFNENYIPQVFEEAIIRGGLSLGILDGAEYSYSDNNLTVYTDKGDGIISLLYNSDTDRILEDIIRNEFSIGVKVNFEILPGSDFSVESYEEQMQASLDEYLASFPPEPVHEEEETPEDNTPSVPKKFSLIDKAPDFYVDSGNIYHIGIHTYDCTLPEVIYGEKDSNITKTYIYALDKAKGPVMIVGKVFFTDTRIVKNEKVSATVMITDNYASVSLKFFIDKNEAGFLDKLKKGTTLEVSGRLRTDKFDKEKCLYPSYIGIVKHSGRKDESEKKRVELHLHTNMSAMDAVTPTEKMIDAAVSFGHKAIAITDHGNLQAFPIAMEHVEFNKLPIKILYGMEAYFVDDTAKAIFGEYNGTFDDEMIVFDLETTGLSALKDKIIEIGAVRIKNCKKIEEFHTYVNPARKIPDEITKLTGITDDMVADAPSQKQAVKEFLDFAGDKLLIAHNAPFDTGFIRNASEKYGFEFKNPYLDTVALSKYVNKELKKHTLDTLANYFSLTDWTHHTAGDDADMLARVFEKMTDRMKKDSIRDFPSMSNAMADKSDPRRQRSYHMIIIAKDKTGLKNLYKIVSSSYLEYYYRYPLIPKTILDEHRDGLIIGSACEAGQLYRSIMQGASEEDIERIADYYDYLEIQPLSNNEFLTTGKDNLTIENLKDINRKIVSLGEKLNKPVCATSDAHYLEKEEDIYRRVLLSTLGYKDADSEKKLYFRTTDEMLKEFEYLGSDIAEKVVIDNPNLIADSVEELRPIPKGEFRPNIEGSDTELTEMCYKRAWKMYGNPLPDNVEARLKKELDSIISNGFAVLYIIAQKLVKFSEDNGYLVGSRGSVGSSFVAHMAGISEVNPLPPHYYCPDCGYNDFDSFGTDYGSGFDLPDRNCPKCGKKLHADGQDIPFETFLGFKGDKAPDIDLNFSGDVQTKVHKYTEDLFGSKNVFKAGTTSTLKEKTAYGFVTHYQEEFSKNINKAEVERIVQGITGVKRTTGQHPGGIVVVPKEYEIYDFMPVQHPADDPKSDIITTHFAFSYLHDTLLKLDELGHDIPTKYKMLERFSGIKIEDVPMNDPAVYTLFTSTEALGISRDDLCGGLVGTYALPEFGTKFVQKMLVEANPKTFSDLLQVSGLSHGTDVWLGNAETLIKEGKCTINDVFGTRDSIMLKLIRWGVDNSVAFNIMEKVRKGKGLTPEWEEIINNSEAPSWAVDSCNKIKYMFPKAHAAAYVMSAIRLGWYKVHHPKAFYAAYFSVAPDGFDATIVGKGHDYIKELIKGSDEKYKNMTATEKAVIDALLIVNESMARGIKYLPVSLKKSDSKYFLPEEDGIRMPFSTLPGLGQSAAEKIVEVVKEEMPLSKEELKERAGVGGKIIDLLSENGALDDLPDTNQITLGFDIPEPSAKKIIKVEEKKEKSNTTTANNLPQEDQITLF